MALNREGVALGADCAKTIFPRGVPKAIRSADKIFVISERPAIALLVHGRLDLGNVPWETLASEFSRHLAGIIDLTPTLDDVAEELVRWLSDDAMFEVAHQSASWRQGLRALIEELRVQSGPWLYGSAEPSSRQGHRSTLLAMGRATALLEARDDADVVTVPPEQVATPGELRDVLDEYLTGEGEALDEARARALEHLVEATQRVSAGSYASGVVIAGFGAREALPSVVEIAAVVGNRDRVHCAKRRPVSLATQPAHLLSYAQDAEVRAFREGVHPDVDYRVDEEWRSVHLLLEAMDKVVKDTPEAPVSLTATVTMMVNAAMRESQRRRSRAPHVLEQPMLAGLAHLTRVDLGAMVEGLVARASWRVRISSAEDETVGDQVNVVVLSRAGGVEWMRPLPYPDSRAMRSRRVDVVSPMS